MLVCDATRVGPRTGRFLLRESSRGPWPRPPSVIDQLDDELPDWYRRLRDYAVAHDFLRIAGYTPLVCNQFGPPRLLVSVGMPTPKRLVAIVSSRVGRNIQERTRWFDYLRHAVSSMNPQDETLLIAEHTTPWRYLRRAAHLFGVEGTHLRVPSPVSCVEQLDAALSQWVNDLIAPRDALSYRRRLLCLSPPLAPMRGPLPPTRFAPRDIVSIMVPDQINALSIRPNGNVHQLVRIRLNEGIEPAGSVRLCLDPQLVRDDVRDELLGRGAVGWALLKRGPNTPPPRSLPAESMSSESTHDSLASSQGRLCWQVSQANPPDGVHAILSSPATGEFLTHCTRRRDGPWPGQSEQEFLDDLIWQSTSADHSALAALQRIVKRQMLCATNQAIRGGFGVVSFTSASFDELRALHVYRSHRGRWDFEPYGISIRASWLAARGARPVVYGDDDTWQRLDSQSRPYFQRATSVTRSGRTLDWTVEREWRFWGNVPLYELGPADAFLFVPTQAEALSLQEDSPWSVYVWQQ